MQLSVSFSFVEETDANALSTVFSSIKRMLQLYSGRHFADSIGRAFVITVLQTVSTEEMERRSAQK